MIDTAGVSGLSTSPSRRLAGRLKAGTGRFAPPFLVLVLVVGAWSLLATTVYGAENFILPRPWDVVSAAFERRDALLQGARITFVESATGFGLAIVTGIASAFVMSQSKPIERSLYPYAVFLQTVPIVTIAPIIVLWVGFGTTAVMITSFIIAVFPIMNNTLLGFLSTDRNQLDLFRLHRASWVQRSVMLTFPGAIPNIIAGLRISAGLAVIGAIVGEFVIGSGGAEGGLGVKVIFAQARLETDLLFAEVIAATLLSLFFFGVVSIAGRLLLQNWHESALKKDAS